MQNLAIVKNSLIKYFLFQEAVSKAILRRLLILVFRVLVLEVFVQNVFLERFFFGEMAWLSGHFLIC